MYIHYIYECHNTCHIDCVENTHKFHEYFFLHLPVYDLQINCAKNVHYNNKSAFIKCIGLFTHNMETTPMNKPYVAEAFLFFKISTPTHSTGA